ncbi:surface antigen-domain-containing protein [Syncephalis fuscata]|nr:surface antigen-domain-containing protein [Syncephalis fuscata]
MEGMSYIEKERADLLSRLYEAYSNPRLAEPILAAETFGEAIERTQLVVSRLNRFGIYSIATGELDKARGPLGKEKGVDVLLALRERNRLTLKTGTEIGDEEGLLNGSVTFRNAFGGAECLEASAAMGTRTPSSFQASFSAPLASNPDHVASIHAYQTIRNKMWYSSHNEMTRGATLRYETISRLGQHGFYYDLAWRNVYNLTNHASMALGHVLVCDQRNSLEMPTDGYLLRMQNDFAGYGGDVHYGKCELEGQWLQSLGRGFHTSLTARGGLLLAMQGDRIRINDRFTLGGPVSLRGFKTFGVGPREDYDMIGGNIYYALGLSLFAPLPKVDSERFKAHFFVNTGTLRLVDNDRKEISKMLKDMYYRPTISIGAGLIYWHSIARVELNFTLPLAAAASDRSRPGFGFGLGVNFL